MASQTVRLMTWNIHGGVGLDGIRDLPRIVDVISAVDPDIIALQEVSDRRAEDKLTSLLCKKTPYAAVSAVTLSAAENDYGQLLLSRWPISNVTIHDISVATYEPRRLVGLISATPWGELHVLATHLGLKVSERRAQAVILREAASAVTSPLVAMGDFNDWLWWHSIRMVMDTVFPTVTELRTFPARLPLFSLDRIYGGPSLDFKHAYAPPIGLASDHLPVVADISWKQRGI